MASKKYKKLRTPIGWFGGKGNMTSKIVPVLLKIEHKHYCEPFGGGASILLAKPPSCGVETYNDIDSGLYEFFSVMSDPVMFNEFLRRIKYMPWSRQFFNEYRVSWQDETDMVARVSKWYLVAKQSFSGNFGQSWSFTRSLVRRDMSANTSRWLSIINMLPDIHERLQKVQIENDTWESVIKNYDTKETLFYCDPPYVHDTRSSGSYAHEMSNLDHANFVDTLLSIEGKAAVSGYDNPIYNALTENGWQKIEWATACYATGRTRSTNILGDQSALKSQKRVECLWVK